MNRATATSRFLEAARPGENAVGDLIRDMRRDSDVPALFPNIKSVRNYLAIHGACDGAMDAVPKFWLRYREWLDRHPEA
jgi:hypothetical protein